MLPNIVDPLKIVWRKGTIDDPYVDKSDTKKIINNIYQLDELPDFFSGVQFTDYVEIRPNASNKHYTPASNEFIVDYTSNTGRVYFNESENGKSPTAIYKGKGVILFPASRVYYNGSNPDVVQNLQDIITQSQVTLQAAQDELQVVDNTSASTKKIWSPPLPTYNDILTTYPNPEVGRTVQAEDTGYTYRWDGTTWQEIESVNTTTYSASRVRPVVFVISDLVTQGVYHTEIRFPFSGTIYEVYATCGTAGSTQTVIEIEHCSADVYDTVNEMWTNIFSTNMTLDANKKTSSSSTTPYVLSTTQINTNDHFRVNISTLGDGIKDLTIELMVQV